MLKYIRDHFAELKDIIDRIDEREIITVMNKIIDCYHREGFVYIFGNGGSGATASHFVNDFNKGASENLPKKFRSCCLNDNISTLMAIANDISYSQIFKMQLQNYLQDKDLVIGISVSGNSRNVIEAIEYANEKGVETVALVGFDGGRLKEAAKWCIHVPANNMQQVEDLHLILNHLMMSALKDNLEEFYDR